MVELTARILATVMEMTKTVPMFGEKFLLDQMIQTAWMPMEMAGDVKVMAASFL